MDVIDIGDFKLPIKVHAAEGYVSGKWLAVIDLPCGVGRLVQVLPISISWDGATWQFIDQDRFLNIVAFHRDYHNYMHVLKLDWLACELDLAEVISDWIIYEKQEDASEALARIYHDYRAAQTVSVEGQAVS